MWASLAAAAAIVAAAIAAQGLPMWLTRRTGETYRTAVRNQVYVAYWGLYVSRGAAIVAALVVVFAMNAAWAGQIEKAEGAAAPSQEAIVAADVGAICGTLVTGEGGQLSVTPSQGTAVMIARDAQIQLVEDCP